MIVVQYEVIEHYDDDPPEPFGFYLHPADAGLTKGDSIMLKWLDGRDAYRVNIERIDFSTCTLHVRAEVNP